MKNQYSFRTNAVWARLHIAYNGVSHDAVPEIPAHLAQIVETMTDDQARAGLAKLLQRRQFSFPTDEEFAKAMQWATYGSEK